MAEHGREEPVLGIAFDGTGMGEDGTSWGGEFLLGSASHVERLATFRPIPLPGGNVVMREVWRTGYALLHDAFDGEPPLDRLALFQVVGQMLERGLNAPQAHGVGRFFDAFGSLGLARPVSSYEGQVAIAWDFAAEGYDEDPYPFAIDRDQTPMQIDLRPTARAAVEDLIAGVPPGRISARFHGTLVGATVSPDRSRSRAGFFKMTDWYAKSRKNCLMNTRYYGIERSPRGTEGLRSVKP